jgi:hypothetical protein
MEMVDCPPITEAGEEADQLCPVAAVGGGRRITVNCYNHMTQTQEG